MASLSQKLVPVRALLIVPILIVSFGFVPSARADYVFTASSGGMNGQIGGPVSAMADFQVTSGSMTLTLTNLIQDESTIGQAIYGITFTTSPQLKSPPTPTLSANTIGTLIDINKDGTYTQVGTNPATTWQVSNVDPTTIDVANGKPLQMIAGLPDSVTNLYGNGNTSGFATGSGSGNAHNPVFEGSATFTIFDSAIGAGTTITGVTFYFGTGPDLHLDGVTVPEPSSVALGLVGFVGMGLAQIRRLVRRNALALA
jgi:hypothetical protein